MLHFGGLVFHATFSAACLYNVAKLDVVSGLPFIMYSSRKRIYKRKTYDERLVGERQSFVDWKISKPVTGPRLMASIPCGYLGSREGCVNAAYMIYLPCGGAPAKDAPVYGRATQSRNSAFRQRSSVREAVCLLGCPVPNSFSHQTYPAANCHWSFSRGQRS